MERYYNRKNRYLLVANFGDLSADLRPVTRLFAGGEVVVDTSDQLVAGSSVAFKSMADGVLPHHAVVIKLPK